MLTNGVKKEGRGQNRARRKAKRERTRGKEKGSEGDGALQLHRECMCACTYCDASTHNNARLNENVANYWPRATGCQIPRKYRNCVKAGKRITSSLGPE